MKTNRLLLAGLLLATRVGFAQGPLQPPGAPGETMKSLDQIEARTPIAALPFTIAESGSYYLTGNLSGTTGIVAGPSATLVDCDVSGSTAGVGFYTGANAVLGDCRAEGNTGAISGDSGGTPPGSTDPNANFTY